MASNEALLDASAFLELEKGLPDQHVDGVEAAIAAANQAPTVGQQPVMRINKASLDRIAAAAKKGDLNVFNTIREETTNSMEAIRGAQVSIFHEHMRLDVYDTQEDLDFTSKDFLTNFQKAHLAKEKNMAEITKALEDLSKQLGELNNRTAIAAAIPGDPLGRDTKQVVAPKMSLKSAANRVIENNRALGARVLEAIDDAKLMQRFRSGPSGLDHSGSGSGLAGMTSPRSPSGNVDSSPKFPDI